MSESTPSLRIFACLPVAGLLAFCVLILHEWWIVGVVADPAVLESYRFGSESMVSHCGTKYVSQGAYAFAAFRDSVLALALASVFAGGYVRRSVRLVIGGYALLFCGLVVLYAT